MSTGKLAAGTYYVSATALASVAAGDVGVTCWIAAGSNLDFPINSGEVRQEGVFTVAETAAVTVPARGTLVEGCDTGGNNGSVAEDAGIIAIRIRSSSHR